MPKYEIIIRGERIFARSVKEVKEAIKKDRGIQALNDSIRFCNAPSVSRPELKEPVDGAELDYWLARKEVLLLECGLLNFAVIQIWKF